MFGLMTPLYLNPVKKTAIHISAMIGNGSHLIVITISSSIPGIMEEIELNNRRDVVGFIRPETLT